MENQRYLNDRGSYRGGYHQFSFHYAGLPWLRPPWNNLRGQAPPTHFAQDYTNRLAVLMKKTLSATHVPVWHFSFAAVNPSSIVHWIVNLPTGWCIRNYMTE